MTGCCSCGAPLAEAGGGEAEHAPEAGEPPSLRAVPGQLLLLPVLGHGSQPAWPQSWPTVFPCCFMLPTSAARSPPPRAVSIWRAVVGGERRPRGRSGPRVAGVGVRRPRSGSSPRQRLRVRDEGRVGRLRGRRLQVVDRSVHHARLRTPRAGLPPRTRPSRVPATAGAHVRLPRPPRSVAVRRRRAGADHGRRWPLGPRGAGCAPRSSATAPPASGAAAPSTAQVRPTTEHVVPRVKGGPSWLENEVAACRRCNSERGPPRPGRVARGVPARGAGTPDEARLARALDGLAAAIAREGGQRRARPYLDAPAAPAAPPATRP